jgi:hypothetical protein
MVVVPLSKPAGISEPTPHGCGPKSLSWVSMLAAGTLAAGGALLVSGNRRAGLVTAATGTALAMLDQKEVVRAWWNVLPDYIAEAQGMLTRVQAVLDDVTAQRERLHQIMSKSS